jgi:integrase
MKLKLDTKTIAGLELAGRDEEIVWDHDLPGFGLRLRRNGGDTRRTFVVQYRISGRRTRRVTLGAAAKFTPPEARAAARKILARVALGADPQGEKQDKREAAAQTFKATADAYIAAKEKEKELRPASLKVAKLYLTGAYFKPLHSHPITTIRRSDIATCIRTIINSRSAPTAAAARRHVSSLFTWAISEGLLGDGAHPVEGSTRPEDSAARDHVLTDAELVAIWNACGNDDHGRIVRLLTLLGSRRQEVGGMRWSEFDLEAGTWTLPRERSKNNHPHTITLPAPALAIIRSVSRSTRDHLFGIHASNGFMGWSDAKRKLDRRLADTVKPWHLHDLRRSLATGMADIGIEPHIIEACLNHFSGHRRGVAGTYNRSSYASQMKAALARWSEHVLALVEGRKSNVVAMRA